MTADVNFHPDGLWHVVRFGYDPELVGLVNLLPSFARKGQPQDKSWRVAAPLRQSTRLRDGRARLPRHRPGP